MLVGNQSDFQQIHGARYQRREFRGGDSRGQTAAELGQAFGDSLSRCVQINAVCERYADDRQTGDRFRPQRRKAGGAVDEVLDGTRHQLLDLLRREARRLGLNIDLRRYELREHVHRGAQRAPATQHQGEGTEHRHYTVVAHAH